MDFYKSVIADTEGKIQSRDMENLCLKSVEDLEMLLERHNNILSKGHLVENLPDQGAKLRHLKERVEAELQSRRVSQTLTSPAGAADALASSLAATNLGEALEWNTSQSSNQPPPSMSQVNPLDPLFDLLQANKSSAQSGLDPYVEVLCKKYDSKSPEGPSKFVPYKSTAASSSRKSASPIGGKAGSPAKPEHTIAQLPITESLLLEKRQAGLDKVRLLRTPASVLSTWRAMAESESEDEVEAEMQQADEEAEEDNPDELP